MDTTTTQKELWSYCNSNEFISNEKIADFQQRLTKEGNLPSLKYALEPFILTECQKCKASGAFKHHFLGKLTHPSCSYSWFASPGTYMGVQLKSVFRTGRDMGGDMALDAEKKGGKGYGEMLFGFIMGLSFSRVLKKSHT